MEYYDTECMVNGGTACVCTKPFDAENARYTDSDIPCQDGTE